MKCHTVQLDIRVLVVEHERRHVCGLSVVVVEVRIVVGELRSWNSVAHRMTKRTLMMSS